MAQLAYPVDPSPELHPLIIPPKLLVFFLPVLLTRLIIWKPTKITPNYFIINTIQKPNQLHTLAIPPKSTQTTCSFLPMLVHPANGLETKLKSHQLFYY